MRARRRVHWGLLAVLILLAAFLGCASQPVPTSGIDESIDTRSAEELMCEIELVRLERLIEARLTDKSFPPAKLVEATALYESARTLCLEREYALALELIKEGKEILEGHRE